MMNEFELIYQLKELKQIKPQRDWVVLTKNQILEKEKPERKLIFFQNILKIFQLKPAFATATVLMLLIIGVAGFFLLTGKEKPIEIAEIPAKPEPTKEIVLALENLQKEIDQATESVKEIKEPQKVLESRNVIIPFVETTKEVLVQLEKAELKQDVKTDNKTLAVKQSIEKFQSAQNTSEARVANNLIEFLKTRTLTEAQQEVLKQAEQAYANRDYAQALINAMLVQQLITN